MTRSHLPEKRSRNDREVRRPDFLEGTPARTRPFSYDEIMHRRKNRENDANRVGNDYGFDNTTSSRGEVEKASLSSEVCRRINDGSGSKDLNHSLNDPQKDDFRKKGDSNMSRKRSILVQDNHKEFRHQDTESKRIEEKNVSSNRIMERRDVKYQHSGRRKHDDSDNGFGERQDRESFKKEKVVEKSKIRSEITRVEDCRDDRQVDRKRKNDQQIYNDYEYKQRNQKDVIKTDKLTASGRDKSEKENRHNRLAKEEDKTRDVSSTKRYNVSEKKQLAKEEDKTRGVSSMKRYDVFEKKQLAKEEDKTRGISSTKRHDVSEKKELEPTRPNIQGSGPKRRRSHSREHAKERGRRSRSHSPEAHTYTSKERKEPIEISLQSTKDKSGREQSYVDKKRISSNESNSHYKRNTAPSSGLGGYSPRKRKTGAGLKTPSPAHRSPDKRTAGWDLQPVAKTSIIAGSAMENLQSTSQTLSWKINETSSITPVFPLSVRPIGNTYQHLVSQMQAIESVQLTEATRPMRRLYVESVPTFVSDKDLIECINKFLLASGVNHVQGTQPCISCIIHREKAQALLEFLTPEDASAALSLDSISFSGSNLKLRRPKDYSATTGILEKSIDAVGSPIGVVEDSPYKIFIGRIPKLISSTMLLDIAGDFGAVKAYHYESNDDINESRAFIEYVDHSVTSKACAALNGMRLGGQVITAVFATPDSVSENIGNSPFYGIPEHAKPLLERSTAVLKLKNVLNHGLLSSLSELDMQEILEDVKLECSRFGMVKSVNISKPVNRFVTPEECEVNDRNASIIEHDLNDGSFVTEEFRVASNEFEEPNKSDPLKTVNGSSQTLEDSNDHDNSSALLNSLSENVNIEDLKRSMVVGYNSCNEDTASQIKMQDEECKPSADENILALNTCSEEKFNGSTKEIVSQHGASVDELESNENISGAAPPSSLKGENMSLCGEDSKLEETNPNAVSPIDVKHDALEDLETHEKDDKDVVSTGHEDIFEPGSVFVEYRRAEAACLAAHSLHGRTFDGRIVTVEYVDHDLYQMRFADKVGQ